MHESMTFRKPPPSERMPFGVPMDDFGKDLSLEAALEYAQSEAYFAGSAIVRSATTAAPPSPASSSGKDGYDDNSQAATPLRDVLSIDESNLLHWHFANLEYGCAGELRHVSNTWWDQDDADGGFHGYHVMFPLGYGQLSDALAENLDVRLGQAVNRIEYENDDERDDNDGAGSDHRMSPRVRIQTASGEWFYGDLCVVTLPLGVLQNRNKQDSVVFSPSLPAHKNASIRKMGAGLMNKVVLQFPRVFWDANADLFGRVVDSQGQRVYKTSTHHPLHDGLGALASKMMNNRGFCYMFVSASRMIRSMKQKHEDDVDVDAGDDEPDEAGDGDAILYCFISGGAARLSEFKAQSSAETVSMVLSVLGRMFAGRLDEAHVPAPIATKVTRWGNDPFSRCAYSYVAKGCSGIDYDVLAEPVQDVLYFAGEHTNRKHPTTVSGAILSGWREAGRIAERYGRWRCRRVEDLLLSQEWSPSEF